MSNIKTTLVKIDTVKSLAELIDSKLKITLNELLVDGNLTAKKQFDFDYDNEGFVLYLTYGTDKQTAQDFTVVFTADVWDRDLGHGENIVEFTDVKLSSIESDSYEYGTENISIDDAEPLLKIADSIIKDANFYRLVDSSTYTTNDSDETYSELSK